LDAGIRLAESLEKEVVAVPISGPLRMAAIASPAYIKRHGPPKTPRAVRAMDTSGVALLRKRVAKPEPVARKSGGCCGSD